MKKLSILLIFFLLMTGCDDEDLCLNGSGNASVYELQVSSFDEISLHGPVNLAITQGNLTEVEVVAEPEMFQELDYSVNNQMLQIGFTDNVRCFETDLGFWINVTVPDIQSISVTGSSEIISDGDLNVDELAIDIDGLGDVSLSGTVNTQIIQIDGSADIQNLNFSSTETRVDVDGSADIAIAVTTRLDIEVDGRAEVTYSGQPAITQNVSGVLDLINVD